MFTARLFLIAKIWKQPKCPLDRQTEWIKKMWYAHTHTHTEEYYSAIEKNEILPLQQFIMLCEISQMEKDKHYITLFTYGI